MPKIDVAAILAAKAPRIARFVPQRIIDRIRRTIHEEEINYMLDTYGSLPPQGFIRACFRYWQVDYTISGLGRLDPAGRYLFVSNHPFGGMDGMMLADKLIEHFGDVRVVVNDLLMHLEPLRPLWIPVNKHGSQSADYARRFDEALRGPLPVLTFPAGLCSRRRGGVVADPQWKTSFLKRARATGRTIVPLFVEGELSDFFYRFSRTREALGIKFNVEMLFLPDEMFSQKGRTFRIVAGEPLDDDTIRTCGGATLREQTDYVREKCYFLQQELKKIDRN